MFFQRESYFGSVSEYICKVRIIIFVMIKVCVEMLLLTFATVDIFDCSLRLYSQLISI